MTGHGYSKGTGALGLCAAALSLTACSGHSGPVAARPARSARSVLTRPANVTTTTAAPTTTTVAPTTSTTVDPGALPQTKQLPSSSDPAFLARMSDLLAAVYSGNAAQAGPAFFPLSAYIQVKGISDPVHDYQTRLIPDYDQDIATLHSEVASAGPLTLDHVSVPDAAEWILPGVEYNKGSYWRVYGTRLWFREGGQLHYFSIASMISWRGEWYVVHLNSIR